MWDADTGQIMATGLTTNDIRRRFAGRPVARSGRRPITSFAGDEAYDRDDVDDAVAERHPEATIIVTATRKRRAEQHREHRADAA